MDVRPGSLRHKSPEDEWVVTEPGSMWYSTASMLAIEYWNGSEWRKIVEDDDVGESEQGCK